MADMTAPVPFETLVDDHAKAVFNLGLVEGITLGDAAPYRHKRTDAARARVLSVHAAVVAERDALKAENIRLRAAAQIALASPWVPEDSNLEAVLRAALSPQAQP